MHASKLLEPLVARAVVVRKLGRAIRESLRAAVAREVSFEFVPPIRGYPVGPVRR